MFSEVIQLGTSLGVRNRTRSILKSTDEIQIFNPTAILQVPLFAHPKSYMLYHWKVLYKNLFQEDLEVCCPRMV